MGLFAEDDEYPEWTRVWAAVDRLWTGLLLLGFGVAFLVFGHLAGRIVGFCMIAPVVIKYGVGALRRRRRGEL